MAEHRATAEGPGAGSPESGDQHCVDTAGQRTDEGRVGEARRCQQVPDKVPKPARSTRDERRKVADFGRYRAARDDSEWAGLH